MNKGKESMMIQSYMLTDPDAIIMPVESFSEESDTDPKRVWAWLKELGEMWNRNDEEEYKFYVEGYWEEA